MSKAYTADEIDTIIEVENFLTRRASLAGSAFNSIYYYAGQPILDNPISTRAEKMLYHSVIGRTALFSLTEMNTSLRSCLIYLLSMRLNALVEYILNELQITTHGLITSTILCFLILVIHSIFTSVQTKMISQKIENMDIFEDTIEDKISRRMRKS